MHTLRQRSPIEIDAAAGPAPLGMPPATFLRDYWQKRPLLVRNAFPGFVSPIEPEDLAGLACEDGVLARLIEHDQASDGWKVRHGPFAEADFPGLPDHDWTLLVQDVDKWDADIRALLARFGFLPRWRIDDIMVSFAATGGSVGAHVDQYDVFLLQAHGQRRWQIDAGPARRWISATTWTSSCCANSIRPMTGCWSPATCSTCRPACRTTGWRKTPCLTFSVGMRAPAAAELLGDYADTLAADAPDELRYADPDLALPGDATEIDEAAIQRVEAALRQLRMDDPDRFGDWFGSFITTYRSAVLPVADDHPLPRAEMEQALADGAQLWRHPWSRMAWRRARHGGDADAARLYAGGIAYPLTADDARRLAAADSIDGGLYAALGEPGRAAVAALLAAGHYRLEQEDEA